ncbi:MAG: YihY/virulence factor BrkB family protein [Verrucomicrobium sp.]|nr:YihY/virulence factor BrkB family protein [Verrucomicrobium sp.]
MPPSFRWRPRKGSFPAEAWAVLRETARKWIADDAPTHAAAISYYAIFAVAPVLIVAIAIAIPILGQREAERGVFSQAQQWMGTAGDTRLFHTAVKHASHPGANFVAAALGVGALLFGSNGIFLQLHRSLNRIWNVPREDAAGLGQSLRRRGLALLMVIVIGFLFLASLLISTGLSASRVYGVPLLGSQAWHTFAGVAESITALGTFTLLFGLLFKMLPDVALEWRDVLPGAFLAALLFDVGKLAIGAWLGRSPIGSSFGAAGSMALFLLWFFYGALIALFGAEFTCVDSTRRRKHRGDPPPALRKRAK